MVCDNPITHLLRAASGGTAVLCKLVQCSLAGKRRSLSGHCPKPQKKKKDDVVSHEGDSVATVAG